MIVMAIDASMHQLLPPFFAEKRSIIILMSGNASLLHRWRPGIFKRGRKITEHAGKRTVPKTYNISLIKSFRPAATLNVATTDDDTRRPDNMATQPAMTVL